VWTCTITDTKTDQVIAPLPSFTQTYTAPSAVISPITRQTTGSGTLLQERYKCTVTPYNCVATSYNWIYVSNVSFATFASGTTTNSATTVYLYQADVSGLTDIIQCAIGYSGGTVTVTRSFTWA